MGNTDITQEAYQEGTISIPRVTGNVVITVETASVTDTTMFTRRTTADGLQVFNNKALLKGVRGNSCLWKQDAYFGGQVTYNNTALFTNIVKGSGTAAADIYYNAHYTGGGSGQINLRNTLTAGHIYVLTVTLKFPNNLDLATTRFIIDQATSDGATPTAVQTYNVTNGEVNITRRIRVDLSGTRLGMRFFYGSTSPNNWIPEGQDGIDFQFRNVNAFDLTSIFGAGNEPTTADFLKMFPLGQYDRTTGTVINNSMTNYISKDSEETTLQNVRIDVGAITGKLNGVGDSVIVFPNNANMPYTSQVEYMQKTSADRGYFVSPYICTGTDIVIKAKFNYQGWQNSSGSYQHVFGTWVSSTVSAYRLVQASTNTGKFYSMLCSKNYTGATGNYAANTDIEVEMSYGQTIINGTTITYSPTQGTTNTGRIMIFNNIKAKLYYFQVYKAGALVVDVIPVRIGNKAGLYDKVAGELLEYVISGEQEPTLIVGNDVPNSFTYGMKSTVCLPQVTPTYIYKQDSKASYIDLDYVPTGQDIKIKTKIRVNSYLTGNTSPWFLANSDGNKYGITQTRNSSGAIVLYCGNTTSVETSIGQTATYEIEMSFGTATIHRVLPTDEAAFNVTLDTTIGTENTGSMKLLEGINSYLYYFQIYKNNVLVVDCIPYRNGEVVGLYDRERDRVFTLTQASGEGVIYSHESAYEELPEPTFDEIKQEDGVWKAYKRISDVKVDNTVNTKRSEYAPLEQEEVYVLDDQTIPTEITVADQGVEEILPTNGATPTTAPAIVEIQYGSIPSRGLLGGLLGGTKGGDSDENEPQEDENEEEPKEDIKESPVIDEKQELKK